MKHTGNPAGTDCDLELTPQEATVNPDATVAIAYSGNVWSRPGCPSCVDQVVVGVENEPLTCVYNGIPNVYPGRSFSGNLSFKAPSTVGTYRLLAVVTSQYTVEDAFKWYREHPEARFQIGTLRVGVAPVVPAVPAWLIGLGIVAGACVLTFAVTKWLKWW